MVEPFKYRFITEQGTRELSMKEFLKDEELRSMVGLMEGNVKGRLRLFLGKTIITYPVEYLNSHYKKREQFELLAKEQFSNPFRFYLPHQGPCLDFINDLDHTFCGLFACNRFGKTTANWIKKLVNCMRCDPKWEIFTEHGVKYREYYKKKQIGAYSYQMSNFEDTIWPQVIRKWTPKKLLGQYAEGGSRVVSWRGQPHLDLIDLEVWFKSSSQSQAVFESQAMHDWMWDEQPVEANFDGANERTRTTNGRHDVAATPHKIDGRPDTGSRSWLSQLYNKEKTKGMSVKFYHGSIDEIPDWQYSKEMKKSAYNQWVKEPTARGDQRTIREGKARYYGIPHQSSGNVVDNWTPEIHLIDPFDIPEDWTKYRAIDHGRVNPEGMLNLAVSPAGIRVFYQEYYKAGLDVSQNVKNIVDRCGNVLKPVGTFIGAEGNRQQRMEEVWKKQKFVKTVLDSRSFSKVLETSSLTLGMYYFNCGLRCTKASGQATEFSVPILNDWFRVDYNQEHHFTGEKGASSTYVFRTLSNFIWEINNWVYETYTTRGKSETSNPKESPRKKDDHLMTCALYLAGLNPRYIQGACLIDDEEDDVYDEDRISHGKVIDSYTGY